MFSLKNPLYFDVFISTLADLSLDAETDEIALAALRLQTLLLAEKSSKINDLAVFSVSREEKVL
jgi:hypothetical protein